MRKFLPDPTRGRYSNLEVIFHTSEDFLHAMKEKLEEPEQEEREPEPTTEILFLCSFEGCGKTFVDVGALRKHAHVHGEKQFTCHYEGCGKVISSKLLFCIYCAL